MAESNRIPTLRDLQQLLSGMEAAVRLIEENRSRDMRRVMLGLLEHDLEKTSDDINQMAAALAECRRKHRALQADATRIRKRDGAPVAPDEMQPLWELGLSPGVTARLAEAGVTTQEQLASLTFDQLVAIPRIGRGTALKILKSAKSRSS